MSENKVLDLWVEIKTLVESVDLDMHKNATGNVTAGSRARKSLRLLTKKTRELVKTTIEIDRVIRDKRKEKPEK